VLPDFIQKLVCYRKKRAKACRKTGPGCFACGGKVFSGLIFLVTFFIKKKSNSPAAIERCTMHL
jgi:hypothetical protein